ncbi:AraC family transcriptional regulator [Arthrobacter sp. MYb229]|nr:AraC family transcriptional regulator [Arthrobacter sp. MYb229]PRB52763.1 AraC family transcriptional regulator [Arthrobacter sp. MYb216]
MPDTTGVRSREVSMYQIQHVDSFSAWSRLISDAFVQLRSEQVTAGHFSASLGVNMLGNIGLMRVNSKAHTVLRTEDLTSTGDGEFYKVSYQLAGHGLLIQDGRETVLAPGDLAIYDTQRPYTLSFDQAASLMVVLIPHHQFRLSRHQVGEITATRMEAGHPLTGTVTPLLRHLGENLAQWDRYGGAGLARNTVDLLATSLGGVLSHAHAVDPRIAQRERIIEFIEQRLDAPELTPAFIAEAHFISVRTLHALFAEEPRSVAALIRHYRMKYAAELLSDPLLAQVSVQSVGTRVGIVDAPGFTRAFAREYGLTPGKFRLKALA